MAVMVSKSMAVGVAKLVGVGVGSDDLEISFVIRRGVSSVVFVIGLVVVDFNGPNDLMTSVRVFLLDFNFLFDIISTRSVSVLEAVSDLIVAAL